MTGWDAYWAAQKADIKFRRLSEYLEFNVAWVVKEAIGLERDLSPILGWVGADGRNGAAAVEITQNKDSAIAEMRRLLNEHAAVQYSMIVPAWMVELDPAEGRVAERLIGEHGTAHPAYRSRRIEVYMISVGDDAGETLTATLKVTRNQLTKRITELTRLPIPSGAQMEGALFSTHGIVHVARIFGARRTRLGGTPMACAARARHWGRQAHALSLDRWRISGITRSRRATDAPVARSPRRMRGASCRTERTENVKWAQISI